MTWLAQSESAQGAPLLKPGAIPDDGGHAVAAWNLLGGEINWAGLPIVAELLGITDVPKFICQLIAIRDFKAKAADNG